MRTNVLRRRIVGAIASCALAAASALIVGTVSAAASVGGGWSDPVDMSQPLAGWLASDCNGQSSYQPGLFHTGRDYGAAVGTAVRSIGSGTVVSNGSFGAGYAQAVFVQYTASDGSAFQVLYGHLDSTIAAGTTVSPGQQLGTVAQISGSPSHLHLGLVPGTTHPSNWWGDLPCTDWPAGSPGPTTTNGFTDPTAYLANHPASGSGGALTGASPIQNGGFNTDTSHWSVSGSANLARYTATSGMGTNPYEGNGYAASNASQPGDSVFETNTASISANDTYCASAEVVTVGTAAGSSGTMALWLLGATNDVSTYAYSTLPGSNAWQSITVCTMATSSRSQVKVQFYPTPGSPTVAVDAVDVHQTLNASGGFNNGNTYWNLQPGTNLATYTVADNTGTTPLEGNGFGATNTTQSGGGFLQDMPHAIAPGDTFCAEADVVTVGPGGGASGSLAVFLTGATATEQSTIFFNNLPGGSAWRHIKTCATATTGHTNIRMQVYPAVDGPTLGIDALDVHNSIALNGGFNADASHWSAHGALGYAQFANFSGTTPYEGSGFEIVQTDTANSSLSESRAYAWGVGDTFCAEASVVTGGTAAGGGGVLALWLLGASTDVSNYGFSALPAGNSWSHIKTCTMATAGTSSGVIKVELYPSTNNLPVALDAVDVH